MLDNILGSHLLEQLGSTQSTPMAVKDRDHRFVYVNEAFASKVGRTIEELLGKNDLELGCPENLVLGDPETGWLGLWGLDDQALNSGNDSTHVEIGNNDRVNFETHRTPLRNNDGEVVGLLVQLHDVGEVRELQRNVENNREALWVQKGEVTTLDKVIASLLSCRDNESLFHQLVDDIVSRTSADGAYLAKVHESHNFLEFVALSGIHKKVFAGIRLRCLTRQIVRPMGWMQCVLSCYHSLMRHARVFTCLMRIIHFSRIRVGAWKTGQSFRFPHCRTMY